MLERIDTLAPLLAPNSVALIGASDDPQRIGGRPLRYLREAGFAGAVFPVNPRRDTVQGLRSYASVADLPETPDVAILAVPAAGTLEAVRAWAARKVKAGVVWINSTNLFDAAVGFGGYKESGFGREGGREGMLEYLVPAWEKKAKALPAATPLPAPLPVDDDAGPGGASASLDRTVKLYVGGKQVRPDSGYSYPVLDAKGRLITEAGYGNRKDIRNAVEAARKADAWSDMTGHARAQVLWFLAENLELRSEEFAGRIAQMTGASQKQAGREVAASVARIIHYASRADKYDGRVRAPQPRMLALALPEPFEVIGISCPDEAPLLGFVSLVAPAIAMGNRVVVTPSQHHPLAACDLYQVLDTSDLPDGVMNIVTGDRDQLAGVMAKHDDIAACWYFGSAEGSAMVERESAGNLKATWVNNGKARDWHDGAQGQGEEFLFRATRIKSIWTPFGV